MISQRIRESRRKKPPKFTKTLDRIYRETKCRDCAVVVTRMDFAKILGKFTKVKIQYESNSTPKTKKNETATPNTRLKSNENSMVLIHRNAYNKHPVKELLSPIKVKINDSPTLKASSNVLKENNRLKKSPIVKDKNSNINISIYDDKRRKNGSLSTSLKHYGIIFVDPSTKNNNNKEKNLITLSALLPSINKSILPSKQWYIEFLPKTEEPTDDKVYDRIAAELEDLMYNEKPEVKPDEKAEESKVDDFPSIMDILNDNSSDNDSKPSDQSSSVEFKSNLESSDVEAMLLGKSNELNKDVKESTPIEVDTTIMSNLIEDVAQLNDIQDTERHESNEVKVDVIPVVADPIPVIDEIENPHSPSILDEALQKGIEEHLPVACVEPEPMDISVTVTENTENSINDEVEMKTCEDSDKVSEDSKKEITTSVEEDSKSNENKKSGKDVDNEIKTDTVLLPKTDITHVIFKKTGNGTCSKTVKCPKNLKYVIELEGKTVEFLGAPKFISSLEDLQVLLQIVDDTDLKSPYVLC